MTKSTSEFENAGSGKINHSAERAGNHGAEFHDLQAVSEAGDAKIGLPESERELLSELAKAIRTIAYGSIVLTIHEGRLVEISKTIRVRRNPSNRNG